MIKTQITLSSIGEVKEFNQIINNSAIEADLSVGKYVIDAKSIMGIFSLNLGVPLNLTIHADKDDQLAEDLVENIGKFIVGGKA